MGQSFNGAIQSDFSGIIGARLNPASIAASPYKYDFSLLNLNYYVNNNISYLAHGDQGRGFARYLDYNQKYLNANASLGGISGFVSLEGNESLGFSYQLRAHGSAIDFTPEFIVQFGRVSQAFANTQALNQHGTFSTALWSEYGLTYAWVVEKYNYTRWKMGGTLKLINSRGSMVMRVRDLDYTTDASGVTMVTDADMVLGYSDNLDPFRQFDGTEDLNRLPDKTGGKLALDFGVVYEKIAFREDPENENGTKRKPDVDYLYKISASITDFGTMSFNYGSASANFMGIKPAAANADFDQLFKPLSSVRAFRDSLATLTNAIDLNGTYKVTLPASLNLGFDYNFGNDFFVGAYARVDMTGLMPTVYKLRYMNSLTLTPRWEKQNKSAYLPIFFNERGDFQVGLAGRLGPITVGTQSIGALFNSEPNTGGFFFSLNIRILKANSDKPYCFGTSRGTAMTNTQRTPLYRRKKWIFF